MTGGYPVRTFSYDAAGRMAEATVFTLTTSFRYNGDGARVAVTVAGQDTTTYTLDYAGDDRILAEVTAAETKRYLYGQAAGLCLGEETAAGWSYYLPDAEGQVRQIADEAGAISSAWLYDPEGTVLEGPAGPVSHLVCGGVYDWSTGLIYKDGRYFDPSLGIWLAMTPLAVIHLWRRRRGSFSGYDILLVVVCLGGLFTGCSGTPKPEPTPAACTDLPPGTPKLKSFDIVEPMGEVAVSSEWPQGLQLHLGYPTAPGAVFIAEVEIPENTIGQLEFLQFKNPMRTFVRQDGLGNKSQGYIDHPGWKLDKYDPYPMPDGINFIKVDSPGTISMITNDSPGQPFGNARIPYDAQEVHVNDQFEMYVLWRPDGAKDQDRVALGMIEWGWSAKATSSGSTWSLISGEPKKNSWRCVPQVRAVSGLPIKKTSSC